MANLEFKDYLNGLFADKNSGEYKLGENERATVNSYIVQESLIGTLGINLAVGSVSESTATFIKNIGQKWTEKEKPGPGDFEKGKYATVSFNWFKPQYQAVAFTHADKLLGVPTVGPIKLEKAAADYNDAFEDKCWKTLEKELKTADKNKQVLSLLAETVTPQVAREKVIALGTALTKHKDEADGINGIKKSDIIIHVKPELLDKLAQSGLVGNFAEQVFVGGQYSIATIGGYKVIANKYLDNIDAVACANFSAGSLINVNAANFERLVPTNDFGMYFEAMSLFGIAYKSCFRTIFNKE